MAENAKVKSPEERIAELEVELAAAQRTVDVLIARLEPVRQAGDGVVAQHAVTLDHQQPRGFPRTGGAQRDVLRRQVEIEEIGAHGLQWANGEQGAANRQFAIRYPPSP